jgi:3-hydroxyacyl-[acyl-carrier-protein] dehydratase
VERQAEAYTGSFGFSPLKSFVTRGEDAVGLMRFTLLDRIVELEPGVRITAIKGLTLSEDYLADHFPRFPVMPGVFMLEAMTQASAWLIRASEDFKHSIVVLREARNVKYANFVAPGQTLTVTAEIISQDKRQTKLKVQGEVDGRVNVSARLVLERYNVADRTPAAASADHHVVRKMRELFGVLYRPTSPGTQAGANGEAAAGAASQVVSAAR